MNEPLSTLEILAAGFQNLANQALAYLPKIVAAIVVLLLGWLLARLLSLLINKQDTHRLKTKKLTSFNSLSINIDKQ